MPKRFEVVVKLEINEVAEDGKKTDFFDSANKWSDVPTEGVLQIEKEMTGFLQRMTEFGEALAAEKA